MKAFICYSHSDHAAKTRFLSFMQAEAVAAGDSDWIWEDGKIESGQPWDAKIRDALESAKIGFVLLNPDLFSSNYPMLVELPTLLAKARAKHARIIPIVFTDAQKCQALFAAHFGKIHEPQMEPVVDGRLSSFDKLSPKEQSGVCHRIYSQARAHLLQLTEGLRVPNPIQILGDPRRRSDEAEKLVFLYASTPHEVMVELVESYLKLWIASQPGHAKSFAKDFGKKLAEWSVGWKSNDHADVCRLLEMGIPREPTHLQIIDATEHSASRIVGCDKFASLLIGIRLTESGGQHEGYAQAKSHFETLCDQDHRFQRCALLEYAVGQCARKQDQLVTAKARLEQAIRYTEHWTDNQGCCSDGACPKGSLLVESVRGLGALYRKQAGKADEGGQKKLAKELWKQADGEFKKAENYLHVFPHHVPNRIRADFLYSYGYFEFEKAVRIMGKPYRNPVSGRKQGLISARDFFMQTATLDDSFVAPSARISIIDLVLGNGRNGVTEMIRARANSHDAKGSEVRLTKFMWFLDVCNG